MIGVEVAGRELLLEAVVVDIAIGVESRHDIGDMPLGILDCIGKVGRLRTGIVRINRDIGPTGFHIRRCSALQREYTAISACRTGHAALRFTYANKLRQLDRGLRTLVDDGQLDVKMVVIKGDGPLLVLVVPSHTIRYSLGVPKHIIPGHAVLGEGVCAIRQLGEYGNARPFTGGGLPSVGAVRQCKRGAGDRIARCTVVFLIDADTGFGLSVEDRRRPGLTSDGQMRNRRHLRGAFGSGGRFRGGGGLRLTGESDRIGIRIGHQGHVGALVDRGSSEYLGDLVGRVRREVIEDFTRVAVVKSRAGDVLHALDRLVITVVIDRIDRELFAIRTLEGIADGAIVIVVAVSAFSIRKVLQHFSDAEGGRLRYRQKDSARLFRRLVALSLREVDEGIPRDLGLVGRGERILCVVREQRDHVFGHVVLNGNKVRCVIRNLLIE